MSTLQFNHRQSTECLIFPEMKMVYDMTPFSLSILVTRQTKYIYLNTNLGHIVSVMFFFWSLLLFKYMYIDIFRYEHQRAQGMNHNTQWRSLFKS